MSSLYICCTPAVGSEELSACLHALRINDILLKRELHSLNLLALLVPP